MGEQWNTYVTDYITVRLLPNTDSLVPVDRQFDSPFVGDAGASLLPRLCLLVSA